jgi:hypothetical protein
MQSRNEYHRRQDEPKVIAISATKTNPSASIIWASGLALLAYSWCSLLLH